MFYLSDQHVIYDTSMLPDTSNTSITMYTHKTDNGGSSDGTTTTYYTIS